MAISYYFQVIIAVFLFITSQLWNSPTSAETTSNVYIVYMGATQHDNPAITEKSHHDMLESLLGSEEAAKNSIIYSYKHGFSGFAATLTESQAKAIADMPDVVRVFPNRIRKLRTTRSWDFLGLSPNNQQSNILTQANQGDGTIIGVIDSGIWPESESFRDDGMGPIPSRWKGICQAGQAFNSTNCNKKLIGARWFAGGIDTNGLNDYLSPRDNTGHGTHCASVAGGRFVANASFNGLAAGSARGGAPLARMAVYKVCWNGQNGPKCPDAAQLKAFDMAIHDGVDIISISVGEGTQPLQDYVDNPNPIGAFHAVAKGITVVNAAGNDGPSASSVEDTSPWFISVAATTVDRFFVSQITLGDNQTFLGNSQTTVKHTGFTNLLYSLDAALDDLLVGAAGACKNGSLNETLVAGNVVICFPQPTDTNVNDVLGEAFQTVANAGGVGLIYAQNHNDILIPCLPNVPCIKVNYEIGSNIVSYIKRTNLRKKSSLVKISQPKSVVAKSVAPRVASFSSRGPSSKSPTVLKPDIAAPGVDILAAYPPTLTANGDGYALDTGTSMACPHVSAVAALIKTLHKDWSPAAIRSAIVTTALTTSSDGQVIWAQGNTRKPADPFDMGGGHVNPNKATDPGLVYDISMDNYNQFLCSMGYTSKDISLMNGKAFSCSKNKFSQLDLNLPSISIPYLKNTIIVTRTLTNVGLINSFYKASVDAPPGVKVEVEPKTLTFNSSLMKHSFKVIFSSTQKLLGDYTFGSLSWTNGKHLVRIPLVVRVVEYESFVDT